MLVHQSKIGKDSLCRRGTLLDKVSLIAKAMFASFNLFTNRLIKFDDDWLVLLNTAITVLCLKA